MMQVYLVLLVIALKTFLEQGISIMIILIYGI